LTYVTGKDPASIEQLLAPGTVYYSPDPSAASLDAMRSSESFVTFQDVKKAADYLATNSSGVGNTFRGYLTYFLPNANSELAQILKNGTKSDGPDGWKYFDRFAIGRNDVLNLDRSVCYSCTGKARSKQTCTKHNGRLKHVEGLTKRTQRISTAVRLLYDLDGQVVGDTSDVAAVINGPAVMFEDAAPLHTKSSGKVLTNVLGKDGPVMVHVESLCEAASQEGLLIVNDWRASYDRYLSSNFTELLQEVFGDDQDVYDRYDGRAAYVNIDLLRALGNLCPYRSDHIQEIEAGRLCRHGIHIADHLKTQLTADIISICSNLGKLGLEVEPVAPADDSQDELLTWLSQSDH